MSKMQLVGAIYYGYGSSAAALKPSRCGHTSLTGESLHMRSRQLR